MRRDHGSLMSDHHVIFSDVNLFDLLETLETESTPFEQLPISTEYKQALLAEFGDDTGQHISSFQCRDFGGGAWVCTPGGGPHHQE